LLGVSNNTCTLQRIVLEAKENEMESRAQHLRQEVCNKSEAIEKVKQLVCMKSAHAGWTIFYQKYKHKG
jgi:hypothetical protein